MFLYQKVFLLLSSTLLIYAEGYINSIDMHFIKITKGDFIMGTSLEKCPKDDPFTEKNEYEVCLNSIPKNQTPIAKKFVKAFYMSTTEVTQLQYYKVMKENPAYFKKEKLGEDSRNNPIENISWYDAKKFIEKLNKMENTDAYYLPNEIEWEYVARAGNSKKWCFGDRADKLSQYAWYYTNVLNKDAIFPKLLISLIEVISDNNYKNKETELLGFKTHPVANKEPNKWGLYDMYGNVWEWTNSCYNERYNQQCLISNGKKLKVLRGGSINNQVDETISAYRIGFSPSDYYPTIGFRVASRLLSPQELKRTKQVLDD